jgi:hypothetical protein
MCSALLELPYCPYSIVTEDSSSPVGMQIQQSIQSGNVNSSLMLNLFFNILLYIK